MKTSKCLMTWGLLSWLALSLPACSGDEVPEALSGTEQTAQASQGQITLKIQAPVPESVVLTKATYQTAEEARVYQLGIYIFEKGSGEEARKEFEEDLRIVSESLLSSVFLPGEKEEEILSSIEKLSAWSHFVESLLYLLEKAWKEGRISSMDAKKKGDILKS